MSFPWYEVHVPEEYRATFAEKYERMILEDARRRAQILHSLGYDRGHAKLRVRGNLRWEYELHELPTVAKSLDGVVDRIYGK